ncbi:MAG TPA: ferric reductase-like transmembrane domain-containing protein [Solirubrobacteraceae bacterium]|nr:ferric reductase-like transmembrane domain-containing protein [Solirubrobacteraceae bacterium]
MSVALGATLSPSAYWYLARGTGAVALVLLTASVVIGILGSVRFVAARWPRFAIDAVHRDVSLLVLVVLVIHIVTSVLDGFAPITLLDGVIPFNSPYRPLWLGLGTLSFDLLVAIAVTSLVRRRLGYRAWRAVHWLAYASWPVAVLHGLGTGSDVKQWWMLALTVVCIMAVLIAVWARIAHVDAAHAGLRAPATALAVITPIGLMIFTLAGPLQHGWAKRAGTPASLLGGSSGGASSASSSGVGGGSTSGSGRSGGSGASGGSGGGASAISGPFTASLSGNVRESSAPGGAVVDLSTRVRGQVRGQFRVRIAGEPIDNGGGLSMTGSQVDLALAGVPSVLQGRINELRGTEFTARVADSQGSVVELHAVLQINNQTNAVTGTLSGAPG